MQFTAAQIAQFLGGSVEGNPDVAVWSVAKIEEARAGAGELVFLSNPKYESYLYTTEAALAIVNNDLALSGPVKTTLVRVENAYQAFAKLLQLYESSKPRRSGISPQAFIHPSAQVAEGAYIGEFAVIEAGVEVGEGAAIYPQVYLGEGVQVGKRSKLYPGVKIYEGCQIGDDVIIHGGTVVGSDGFGFAPTEGGDFQKIPQIGNVVIEDRVEIGANCCIDRATMGSTRIKSGVKLDNLIQIAHNVVIGENTVMASQVGIAGSTKIGRNVMMGGQVGVVGHLTIADGVKVGSQSGIGHDVTKEGEVMFGSPATPGLTNHKAMAVFKQLPELRKQLMEVVRQVKELKERP